MLTPVAGRIAIRPSGQSKGVGSGRGRGSIGEAPAHGAYRRRTYDGKGQRWVGKCLCPKSDTGQPVQYEYRTSGNGVAGHSVAPRSAPPLRQVDRAGPYGGGGGC